MGGNMLLRNAKSFFNLTLFTVLLALAGSAAAQSSIQAGEVPYKIPQVKRIGEGSKYYLNEANELLIRVNIWGKVQKPGQFYVPAETDLISALSMAGGPGQRARLSDVTLVHEAEGDAREVMNVNVRKYLKTGDPRLIPDLKPEDTIVVHGSAWQLVADVASVLGQFGIVANVYYFFFVAN